MLAGPAVPYGASGEHEGAPGTVWIGTHAPTVLLLELGRSASRWAARLLLVNGHGGNLEALATTVGRLRSEGRDAAWWTWSVPGGDAHAGHTETSMLLALVPEVVRQHRMVVGDRRPLAELLPELRRRGVLAVSPTGVLGDPTHADPAHGRDLLARLSADLAAAVASWEPRADGFLPTPARHGPDTPP